MMTKKEQQRMRRLELENEALRAKLEKHFAIYRDQLFELVHLQTSLDLVREALDGS